MLLSYTVVKIGTGATGIEGYPGSSQIFDEISSSDRTIQHNRTVERKKTKKEERSYLRYYVLREL